MKNLFQTKKIQVACFLDTVIKTFFTRSNPYRKSSSMQKRRGGRGGEDLLNSEITDIIIITTTTTTATAPVTVAVTTTTKQQQQQPYHFPPPSPSSLFLLLSCLIFICITYQLSFPIHMSSQSSASHKFLPQCFFCVTLSQICSFNLDPCLMPECFPFSSTFQHYYRIPTI